MAHTNPHHERRWLILAVVGIAQLMVVLDATVVNIALPSAQRALHFTNDNRQWVITAYALAFGSLLLLGGRISDFFGRKWTFIVGLLGFAAASAFGGAAQSFDILVGARAIQGAFGALLAPAALSLLTTTFTDAGERARAFGLYGAIAGSGASIGLLLGGALTQVLDWRFTMYINIIFAVIATVGALALLVNQRPSERPRFDIPGIVTVSGGVFSLVYGLNHAQTTSWGNSITVAFLAAAAALLGAFVLIERHASHPLLPLRVVTDRNRGAAFLSIGIAAAAIFAVFMFLTYYMQQNLGFSPILNGVAFLPMTATIIISAGLASTRLVPRVGPRPLIVIGMLLGAGGMLYLTGIGVHSSYLVDVLPSLAVMGAGFGLIFAPAMATATLGVATQDAGVASAMVNANQQIGGSVGVALLSTVAASAVTGFIGGARPTPALIAAATVHGYTTAFMWSAGIFALGALVAGLLFAPGTRVSTEPVSQPVLVH
ncbi:MAG TPA: MFS transporter [Solirubrobacteraceae bacterium]|nr:MFS transporter [Solirubrobacteraceae bacterium]